LVRASPASWAPSTTSTSPASPVSPPRSRPTARSRRSRSTTPATARRKSSSARPSAPRTIAKTGARALTLPEVEQLRDAYIAAAVRAEKAGFDGVEIHGAHGYILAQFLSDEINHRTDQYGGTLESRARIIFEIIDGIRAQTRPDFQLGLRLSPERFGLKLAEIRDLAAQILRDQKIDFLDMSLWTSRRSRMRKSSRAAR